MFITVSKCKICKQKFNGRSDKLFCSVKCKNIYHTKLRKITQSVAIKIDRHLHRNRSILLEILGKTLSQIKISRIELQSRKFMFLYHTHQYINSKGKTMHYVYDLAWMEFSDDEVLIVRKMES